MRVIQIMLLGFGLLTASAVSAQTPAPGQTKADYYAWLARSADHREAYRDFRAYLEARDVRGVVPTWQLLRTASDWQACASNRFEVAPTYQWGNIVDTLAFIRREVWPTIGPVEALSGYRNPVLNACAGGRPQSAHRLFHAMDLTPINDVTRAEMIAGICRAHRVRGARYDIGLGFYTGLRFHLDSNGFRKWGPDGRGATSPCNSV